MVFTDKKERFVNFKDRSIKLKLNLYNVEVLLCGKNLRPKEYLRHVQFLVIICGYIAVRSSF